MSALNDNVIGYLNAFKGARTTGTQLWDQMLKDSMALYQGDKAVTDMPFWGQMQNAYMDMMSKQMKNIYAQAQSRGLPLAGFEQMMQELMAKGTGNLIQGAYSQGIGQGDQAWQNYLGIRNPMVNAAMQPSQKKNDFNWMSLIPVVGGLISGIASGFGGGTTYTPADFGYAK